MAPAGSTRFVGRLKEMWKVHSLLRAGDVAQVSYATAATGGIGRVSGLGGVGKSLLAEEYALHFGSAYPGGVFWVRAYGSNDAQTPVSPEQREALRIDQVRRMAEWLGIDTKGMTEEQVEGTLARKIASGGQPCLWVVDDVPNGLEPEELRRWFAPNALARTLITTRSGGYTSLTNGIDLSVLEPDEAYQLLASRREPSGKNEEEQARLLAAALGFHALALDITASALLSSVATKPFADFHDKLARLDKDAMVLADTLAEALPNGHQKSITQTMLRSLQELGAEGQDFLRLASVLAVAPIPGSLVTAVFQEADKLSGEHAEERASLAFKQVTSASLAEIAGKHQEARAVHTLVSRTVRFQKMGSPERGEALRTAAIRVLREAIATAVKDPRLHEQFELQVAHGRQVVSNPATADEAALVSLVARYDRERGAYASARTLNERALELRRRVLGPEHPKTLTSMNNLAVTLQAQGDLTGACKLQEETLDSLRRVLGSEHPDTLTSMNNLASILLAQGDLAGARKLQQETLDSFRRVLGSEHPRTLTSMSNLAQTLSAQGDLAGAHKLQQEALDSFRRVLGPAHPSTLSLIISLASTLSAQGDLAGARKLQEETLDGFRRVLGPEHPKTLTSMNNVAGTLFAQGDLAGARKLQEETLDIRRRVLGPVHPRTLHSTNDLAEALSAQGDLAGARKLQEETLDSFRRVLGPEHPDTLTSMNNLASTLLAQGDLAGARKLQEETLDIRRRVLGPEHPNTSISAWNLFVTLQDMGEPAAELAVLKRHLLWLLDRDTTTLGADQRKIREYVAHAVKKND